jgi:hypothetical protein
MLAEFSFLENFPAQFFLLFFGKFSEKNEKEYLSCVSSIRPNIKRGCHWKQ